MNDLERMKELIAILSKASKAYYAEDNEIMSNFEYDKLYDELVTLEKKTGTVLAGSLTMKVGYEAVNELPKETHKSPMLSLDKTKNREELKSWLNNKEGVISWKLDGLTIVLTYSGGKLLKAVTRGNGEVGEVITGNARTFVNIPLSIPFKGELVLRGEAVITYSDFEKINDEIEAVEAKYKNPRNLCSGSVRQLNNEITAARNVRFYAFNLVSALLGGDNWSLSSVDVITKEYVDKNTNEIDFGGLRSRQFEFLEKLGFDVVEHYLVTEENILERIQFFADTIENNDVPSDGLVLTYEDIEYGKSLGRTAKFPRDAIAFKWQDEIKETRLLEIEWSPSRTGLINPVAIFEPVELEGTTVKRASVHNISIVRNLELGIGDTIRVYKANMIIPQIEENITRSNNVEIPKKCPICGANTEIRKMNDTESLYCPNLNCAAKQIKAFTLFVSRDAMNIDGFSEATLEKFIDKGFIHNFADVFKLKNFKEQLCSLEGFGEKSYYNLISAIDDARHVTLPRVIYSLGILNVGLSGAKLICKAFDYDVDRLKCASVEELSEIDGVGEVIAGSFVEYFSDSKHVLDLEDLLKEITLEIPKLDVGNEQINGKTFVITGSLIYYENRNALKELIESMGGKVSGSVSAKTDYLINNDIASGSSKNKKAKELSVPIITEDDFRAMLN